MLINVEGGAGRGGGGLFVWICSQQPTLTSEYPSMTPVTRCVSGTRSGPAPISFVWVGS